MSFRRGLFMFLCLKTVRISGYDDISKFKTATQSSISEDNQHLSPDKAVDKDISTCSSTGADNPAWWYVDLQEIKSIHDIQIHFDGTNTVNEHRQRERMYGFQLYISNTTDLHSRRNMHLCHKSDGVALPNLTSSHVCESFGRYVIFYNERVHGLSYPPFNGVFQNFTFVQLCEVIVHGCDAVGRYGQNCFDICPVNCQEKRCYITNGTCVGCTAGWRGDKCDEKCIPGKYGIECSKTCSGHCVRDTYCNATTGNCDDGCDPGFYGKRCDQDCPSGRFGENCKEMCSGNCLNDETCDIVNGVCLHGCKAGFQGILCNEKCTVGTFGDCTQKCSGECSNNETCDFVDGHCKKGCNPGYQGLRCEQQCIPGKYGIECSKTCSGNCVRETYCNATTGNCDDGCDPGFYGKRCDQECIPGRYGQNCALICSKNCVESKCNHTDGKCSTGVSNANLQIPPTTLITAGAVLGVVASKIKW